jgi:hypothetical protein
MANERRGFSRLAGPFDGSWDGASGMRECRITDLSPGGCFIDAYASQPVGARIITEIRLAGQEFRMPAEVAYVDRIQGFAVRFVDKDAEVRKAFEEAIGLLAADRASPDEK